MSSPFTIMKAWLRASVSVAAMLSLSSCALFPDLQAQIGMGHIGTSRPVAAQTASAAPPMEMPETLPANVELMASPGAPAQAHTAPPPASATAIEIAALVADRPVEAALPPQPVAQFIDTVFGQVLHVPYYTGPGVAQRRELITMRGPVQVSSRQFFVMAQMALAQYGLAVAIDQGSVRVIQDDVLSGQAPNFVRTRTLPETPASSRPVVQFFALSAIDAAPLMQLLDGVYPNRGSVRFTADEATNSLMIMGSARDVAAADALIEQLDQPRFAGAQAARVRPIFMSADQLADALTRTLTAEGYQVSSAVENKPRAISFVPLENAGQLLIFASDPNLFQRALYWTAHLDTAEALGDREGVFIYTAVNTSAEDLGNLIAQATPGGDAAPAPNPPEVAVRRVNGQRVGAGAAAQSTGPTTHGAYTVDPAGNRILFHGAAADFAHARALLQQLDTPPQQVMIELTIAEVTLTDETRFGVEWFLDQTISNGTLTASTVGAATPRDSAGLGATITHAFTRGTVQAALSAFASNNNLNILSTPRLVTRSGSEAQILIGTDVPIITSQRAADQQTGGNTDVLQTVQYRQTGVILNVRPVVYGDNRVDIQLYQEVSSQTPNTNTSIASPLISNRSVTTQLSLQEGMTAVIGGLIQDNYSRDQRGVPGLKDVPVLGAAFRRDAVSGSKVELVILVTPYVIRNSEDMSEIASNYANAINRDLSRRGPQVYTLLPWRAPYQAQVTHRLMPPRSAAPPAGAQMGEPETAPPVAAAPAPEAQPPAPQTSPEPGSQDAPTPPASPPPSNN